MKSLVIIAGVALLNCNAMAHDAVQKKSQEPAKPVVKPEPVA